MSDVIRWTCEMVRSDIGGFVSNHDYQMAVEECDRLRAALSERDRMLGEAVELIHEGSDHEKRPCSHDHHGTCQEHPGASYEGCPVAKSRAFLSAYDASKTAGKGGE